jgi:NDP-sugar pyrophosphorylase family protein
MKAMILAAGLGTRLRPLTDSRPKALVEVGGRTLLEITLARLREAGVTEVIINVHHHAQMVADYLRANGNFGLPIEISREEDLLLDTGGGLKKAAQFFLEGLGSLDQPFILHNVDVITNIDLKRIVRRHEEKGALTTLAVQKRDSSRQLLFDDEMTLCGRRIHGRPDEIARKAAVSQPWAFSGIHVISARLLKMICEEGVFSIIDVYLRLAAKGELILGFPADEYYWRDVGRLSDLKQANEDAAHAKLR